MPIYNLSDFTAGLVDIYLAGPPHGAERMDNLLLNDSKRMIQRPGVSFLDESDSNTYQTPVGTQTINNIAIFDLVEGDLDTNSTSSVYRCAFLAFSLGVLRNTSFTLNRTSEVDYVWDLDNAWRTPFTDDGLQYGQNTIIRLYNDTGVFDDREFAASATDRLTVERARSGIYVATDSPTEDSSDDPIYSNRVKRFSGWTDPTVSTLTTETAGLPPMFDQISITATTAGSTFSYLYAYCLEYEYTFDGITTRDLGPVFTERVTSANAIDTPVADRINLVLADDLVVRWPDWHQMSVAKILIFRTIAGGSTFYRIDVEDPSGPTTADHIDPDDTGTVWQDFTTDADLISGEVLYTDTGEPDNDPPPAARWLTRTENDIMWYAAPVSDTGTYEPYYVYQSKPSQHSAVPRTFFVTCPQEIVGMDNVDIYPVVFSRNKAYRIEGAFDTFGNGNPLMREIDASVGCISGSSIVKGNRELFWWAQDGIYWTNGYQVRKLTDGLEDTYQNWLYPADGSTSNNTFRRIKGTYEPKNKRVYWFLNTFGDDRPRTVVLDMRWQTPSFQTFSSDNDLDLQAPSAEVAASQYVLMGDNNGYLKWLNPGKPYDFGQNTGAAEADWERRAINYDYISSSFNMGDEYGRKWVPALSVRCKNHFKQSAPNLSLQITSLNDDDGEFSDDLGVDYSDDELVLEPILQKPTDKLFHKVRRHFPRTGLRCKHKQIRLQKAREVYRSSVEGVLVTISGVNATLESGVWSDFLSDPDLDNYKRYSFFPSEDSTGSGVLITSISGATLVLSANPGNNGSGRTWRISGRPRNEFFTLENIAIEFVKLGESDTEFSGGTSNIGQ